ncbi:MAG: ABC transporter substrate binding protein [Candidatus Thiodiazotropha endolucinida]
MSKDLIEEIHHRGSAVFGRSFPILVFVIVAVFSTIGHAAPKKIDIAVVSDGKSPWSDQVVRALYENLADLGGSEFHFRFSEADQHNIQWSLKQAEKEIDKTLADGRIEIVVALGVISSHATVGRIPNKPLVATTVINAKAQNFPVTEAGTSGVDNFHFLVTDVDLIKELKRFQTATGAEHVGILIDSAIAEAIPAVGQEIRAAASDLDYKITPISVGDVDINAMVRELPTELDALFILPLPRLSDTQRQILIQALTERPLPTFTTMGRLSVESGYLMGTGMIPDPKQLARQLAVDIRDISLGRSASDLPVAFSTKDRLIFNMSTARSIGYEPPFAVLFESDVINEQPEEGRLLTLDSAVDESLKHNLSVAVAEDDLRLVEDDTRLARSSLLPQVSVGLEQEFMDRDLVGTGATRATTASLSLSQSIYSESKRSSYTSSQFFEQAQAASLESTRLDIIQDTARAYLNVLVAKTERDIQHDNVKLTRANLERAQFRYKVGAADRSEVHRFETELGSALQSLSNSHSSFQQAKNTLNQILKRPIEEPFRTKEPNLSDPKIFGDDRLEAFISSPKKVTIFRDFLAEESLKNAPELTSLRHQISAQERVLLAAKRKRYVPDVDLIGKVERVLDTHGEQTELDHDEDWSVGVQFALPLYQGSRISVEKSQARTELRRLHLLYKQNADAIEVSARNSVAQAGASRMNIDFARNSAEAAEKTLALITDSYIRGTASYIDLIDAQNTLLTALLSASNAEYQHLTDLIELQRAIGFFDFHVATEQEDAWFNALDEYARTYGMKK